MIAGDWPGRVGKGLLFERPADTTKPWAKSPCWGVTPSNNKVAAFARGARSGEHGGDAVPATSKALSEMPRTGGL